MERTCKKCGETKPIEEFRISRIYKDKVYYMHICRKCYNINHKFWRKLNSEILKSEYERNRDKMLIRMNEYAKKRTDNLHDSYVAYIIKNSINLSIKIIRQHPGLIENWRQQIRIKRLLKQKKNDIKTS